MKIDGINAGMGMDISKLDLPMDGLDQASGLDLSPGMSGASGSFNAPDIDMEGLIKDAVKAVDAPQQELTGKINNFLQGKEELHNVMIAAEQARFSINFTVKVRDKIIDAYNTVMKMQV
ncbi:MAG: flagellar hook-basal body complex protein FliE [Candidatus Goldiibacteriota bacterium]|jgi:flagellar hook-basal body complex protein FliE